ncbi:MAG: type II toxin-antitoxin system VapC family toxin [Gammaproteobacteria bacterium]|nr:type II toxin-antitoxin system VapC family toxin [Gammaproteobacteria bacterium]
MLYMLDTNICIYLIKQHPPEVLARMAGMRRGDVVMSVVSYAELRAGLEMQTMHRQRDEQVLGMLTQRIPVLPFDESAAECYGVLRSAVRDRKRNALDRLIAAHARSLDVTLVTNNENDFIAYPELRVENWVNS